MKTIHQLLLTTVRNAGLGIGGIAILCVAITLAAPRAAHAVVATLVQVANTAANPVPNLDTERNARIPYESTVQQICPGQGNCNFNFTTVPSGYRLVAESVNALIVLPNGTTAPPTGELFDSVTFVTVGLSGGAVGGLNNGFLIGTLGQRIVAYIPQGALPQVTIFGSFDLTADQIVTLSGYLENCSVTGCPAIQH